MWRKLPLRHISPILQNHTKYTPRLIGAAAQRTLCSQPTEGVPYETLQKQDTATPQTVPSHADAVIIGGGSIGCNTLYHLTKLGMTNVVLLERDQLTAGTTWHTAGRCVCWYPASMTPRTTKQIVHWCSLYLRLWTSGQGAGNQRSRCDEGIDMLDRDTMRAPFCFPTMRWTDVVYLYYSMNELGVQQCLGVVYHELTTLSCPSKIKPS